MTTAGYSGTPLPKKLGVKPGARVLLVAAPTGFEALLTPLPEGVVVHRRAGSGQYDVIVAFCTDLSALLAGFPTWRERMTEAGGLWIGWPKKSSGVPTDLTDAIVREHGLAQGLVDNKVAALDETWSGLRFVIRLADRS